MSTRCLNKVTIIGNIGEEPRLTSTSNNTPVCTFRVATNRSWTPKGETEEREETEWHYVVSFGKLAEICKQILQQGSKVYIGGRIQNRDLTNSEGESFRRTEIVASEMIALSKRKNYQKSRPELEKNQTEKTGE